MVVGKVEKHYMQYKNYGNNPECTCVVKDIMTDKYWVCLMERDGKPEKFNQFHQEKNMYNFEGEEDPLDPELFETLPYAIQDYIRDTAIPVSDIIFVKEWNNANVVEDVFLF